MSLSSALFAGVSGLNTLGNSMAVIGDNIANVNTIGFKSARTTFETLLAQNIAGASGTSQVGRGVALSSVDPIFSQGSFESTNEPTDMAIGGKGFFMVRSPETGMYYTRAGHFKLDEEGYLVNPANLRVQGWILEPDESDPRGAITDIQINSTSSAPNATDEVDIAVNLDTDELFVGTGATVESSPDSSSGFTFQDGVNDSFVFNDGSGPQTVDLISTSNDYFEEGEVYTGDEVASMLQSVLDDNSTNSYTVSYSSSSNTYSISTPAGQTLTIDDASTMEGILGLSTTSDTTIAADSTVTGDEVAYNITSLNSSFVVSVDGGNDVTVSLDTGMYTITDLRVELEDKINEALAADGQSVSVDVRYDFTNNRFQIISSSRGGRESRIQLSALEGTSNNFLPTINMTDYTEHLGEASNGYTTPGFTESAESNTSAFIFRTTNSIIQLTDASGTNRTVSLLGQTSSTYGTSTANTVYTGEAVAEYLETALGAADYDVSYDSVTNRFTIQNNNATPSHILWENSSSTASSTLGFVENDTIALNDAVSSDNGVAFNIIADQNDEFDVIVDGNPENSGTPVTVTIDAGAYTGDSLASELQQKINEALAAEGESVSAVVTYNEAAGRMVIASSTLGPQSSIQVGVSTGMGSSELLGGTMNIDDDTVNYGMGFEVSSPDDSSNYSTSIVVYDSLGNQHTLTFYLRKAAVADDKQSTTWEWFAYVPSSDTASGEAEVQARGTLTFNEQGVLTGQSPTQWLTTQPDGSPGEGFDFGSGAEPQQEIAIDFGLNNNVNLSTQYASPSSTIFQSQDGFGSGFLESVSVDPDGVISGNYSNGQVLFLARVALANFTNPWGLSRVGGNVWAETRSSGQPLTGTPGSAGLGKISPNSLEQSNVDLSSEFVNMIIQQRGFQANSRIITTTDAMLSELINLKR